YQTAVFSGAMAAARDADVNLICFTGGVLNSPDGFGARRNGVYDLANAETLDGLVILSGTIGNHVGPDELARYCQRFQGLPMANIGVELPGIPTFLVDNTSGLQKAVRHLVEVHGLRRIAFIRGPEVNEEAEQRLRTYRDTLLGCGLPYDPDLVTPGNFQAQAGAAAVRTLLDDRRVTFDAIVAANDDMALGAMAALRLRNVRIPEQVAIVGFDDVENARFASVPMATVRQPLWEQGRLATHSVITRMRGGVQDLHVVLPSEFVPRRSCGCRNQDVTTAFPHVPGANQDSSAGADGEDGARAYIAERVQAERRMQAEQWIRTLRRTGEVLLTSFDTVSLAAALAEQMPTLGIPSCYLAMFEESPPLGVSVVGRPTRLLLAYDAQSGVAPMKDAGVFQAHRLVPPDLMPQHRPYALVVEPLFFDEQPLGFVVLEVGPPSGVVYEALRSQIATALKGALLVGQVRSEARRREIEEKNLRQAQKMEAVGTLASGIAHEINTPMQFTTDTVNFLNEAFGAVGAAFAAYRDRARRLAEAAGEMEMLADWDRKDSEADLDYFLSEGPPSFARAMDGLSRVATIVRAMKEFAHPGEGVMGAADMNRALTTTLAIARSEYKYVADVTTSFGVLPPVVCHIGDLNQVFVNLLVNAAHAIQDVVKDSGKKGQIRVGTAHVGEHVEVQIADTGCGIPEAIVDRIFDPFFTTKDAGKGTGQGLAIARSIVVDRHGGKIVCDSKVGIGTTFTISIPVEGVGSTRGSDPDATALPPRPNGVRRDK
ncbi:MAG: substrate-binding domain-containing protein, partial [Myxococcales bacterium]